MDAARFAEVLQACSEAIAGGGLTSEELQECYRLQGEAYVALGTTEKARSAFANLLVLNPEPNLGEFVSPKITEVVEAARAELGGATLVVRAEARTDGGVDVAIETDPLQAVAGAQLRYAADAGEAEIPVSLTEGRGGATLPKDAPLSVAVCVLDASGNSLRKITVARTLPSATPNLEMPGSKRPSRPLHKTWWVWAAGSASVVAIGAGFGAASASAQDDLDEILRSPGEHFYGEAKALEDKARFRAGMANASFVVAGGLAAASIYFFVRERGQESGPTLTPSVDPDGATSLVLQGEF